MGDPSLNTFDGMLAGDVRDPCPDFVRLRNESPVLCQEPSVEGGGRLPDLQFDQHAAERTDAHIHGSLLFRSPTALPVTWSQ